MLADTQSTHPRRPCTPAACSAGPPTCPLIGLNLLPFTLHPAGAAPATVRTAPTPTSPTPFPATAPPTTARCGSRSVSGGSNGPSTGPCAGGGGACSSAPLHGSACPFHRAVRSWRRRRVQQHDRHAPVPASGRKHVARCQGGDSANCSQRYATGGVAAALVTPRPPHIAVPSCAVDLNLELERMSASEGNMLMSVRKLSFRARVTLSKGHCFKYGCV